MAISFKVFAFVYLWIISMDTVITKYSVGIRVERSLTKHLAFDEASVFKDILKEMSDNIVVIALPSILNEIAIKFDEDCNVQPLPLLDESAALNNPGNIFRSWFLRSRFMELNDASSRVTAINNVYVILKADVDNDLVKKIREGDPLSHIVLINHQSVNVRAVYKTAKLYEGFRPET